MILFQLAIALVGLFLCTAGAEMLGSCLDLGIPEWFGIFVFSIGACAFSWGIVSLSNTTPALPKVKSRLG